MWLVYWVISLDIINTYCSRNMESYAYKRFIKQNSTSGYCVDLFQLHRQSMAIIWVYLRRISSIHDHITALSDDIFVVTTEILHLNSCRWWACIA